MFELEALLLGLEPITALTVGIGALVLVPAISAVNSLTGNSLSDSAKSAAKGGLIFAFDAFDKAQSFVAETGESIQDLISEAKADRNQPKNGIAEHPAREVMIVQ